MSRVGDTFAVNFANDVIGPVGVVIPKGTAATAQVSSVSNKLNVDMQSIVFGGRTYALASDVTYTEVEKVRRKSSANKGRIAAGAGIGAVAGGVIGGNPATTVLGAAAGGLAGAVAGKRPVREDRCVPDGGRIDVRHTEPLKLALTE
jgi:outer membrane lipoprotein SlyB